MAGPALVSARCTHRGAYRGERCRWCGDIAGLRLIDGTLTRVPTARDLLTAEREAAQVNDGRHGLNRSTKAESTADVLAAGGVTWADKDRPEFTRWVEAAGVIVDLDAGHEVRPLAPGTVAAVEAILGRREMAR